ncbi:hypothetical protein [Actinoplanes auranticolor]|uniref:Uncharacterized protein n=1 Tax=Actinoplanes auranticolor TaxID=47988 RepID=A0A919SG15_9ACTN|nr:hypothetical protein [Actinoplanes auranticolor]GIM71737.1 hypothetical protein Aau02nite_47450 [Actinoplanes auranticolor]
MLQRWQAARHRTGSEATSTDWKCTVRPEAAAAREFAPGDRAPGMAALQL